jgi:hypothetical protein
LHFVAADPRDVQQVVDQAYHVRELPVHHRPSFCNRICLASRQAHHLQAIADRREWIAQLVSKECQEVVLLAVRFQQCFFNLLPFGHVAEDQHGPNRGAVLVPQGRGAVVDGFLGAVPGDEYGVVS